MWARSMALQGGKGLTRHLNILLQLPTSHSSSCPHTARQGDSRRSQGGDSRALASAGQGMLEEPRHGGDSVSGSPQGPCAGPALRCQHWVLVPSEPTLLSARQGAGASRAHPQRSSTPWPGHSGSGCGLSTAGSSSESSGLAPCQPRSTAERWAQAEPSTELQPLLLPWHCSP